MTASRYLWDGTPVAAGGDEEMDEASSSHDGEEGEKPHTRASMSFLEFAEECSADSSGHLRFSPWGDDHLARYIAPRLGIDFGYESGRDTAELAAGVEMVLVMADAKEESTYELLQSRNVIPELIYIDPPFGIGKHSEGDDSWDELEMKWGYEEVQKVLEGLRKKGRLFSKEGFCVATYMQTQDVGEFLTQMEEWFAGKEQQYCGHVQIALLKDGEAHLRAGVRTNGHFQTLVVLKVNNGNKTVVADDAGGKLGGRFVFSFPHPGRSSRYMRPEMDARLIGDQGQDINRTQKSLDECRLIIRLCTPGEGWVLSVCNGTGTAMIAAALEGRSSVGIENSVTQNVMCRKRIDTFLHKEALLVAALEDDRSVHSKSVLQVVTESTEWGQLVDTTRTTQGEGVLSAELKQWLQFLDEWKGLMEEYAGFVPLAPYYLRSLSVDHINHLNNLDNLHRCTHVFDRKDWKKLVLPIATARRKVPTDVIKYVITANRRIDARPKTVPIDNSEGMETTLWLLAREKVTEKEKKDFNAKFAGIALLPVKDQEKAFTDIEEQFAPAVLEAAQEEIGPTVSEAPEGGPEEKEMDLSAEGGGSAEGYGTESEQPGGEGEQEGDPEETMTDEEGPHDTSMAG
jgi:hypothetical protein